MTETCDIAAIMNPPERVQALRRTLHSAQPTITALINLYRPYVDGLKNLPRDGRFLLVGNHTQIGIEAPLISHFIHRELGRRVRPLAERAIGQAPEPIRDMLAAYGAVVGSPESARELMQNNESMLVFPGGGRELPKFKNEEYTLRWDGRSGFARLSVESDYPIVPVGLVGGDDLYESLLTRDSRLGQLSLKLTERLFDRRDFAPPLMRGIGPTLIPRPHRMYLRFAAPISTIKPHQIPETVWVENIKQQTQDSLEQILAELQEVRARDPYRTLNPLAWRKAILPAEPCES